MNLQQWRQDPSLIEKSRKVQDGSVFKGILEVMNHELPTNHVLPLGATGNDFAYQYGLEVGYRRAIGVLAATSQPIEDDEARLEADFSQITEQ